MRQSALCIKIFIDKKQPDNLKNITLAVFASNAISAWINKIK